jgi:Arc/MetJ-type ribon-helix-helix transcriptional regulator
MKTLSLKISESLQGDLTTFAAEKGMSRSAVVREALTLLLERGRPRPKGSALAMVEDLAGAVEGPEDLASNPSYLDDLGR